MCGIEIVLLLLLLIFCDTLLSYCLILIRTITAPGIPVRRNNLLPVAGPVNLVLPPGDTVPVVDNPDTEDRAEMAATAAVVRTAGKLLVAAAADARIEHQRVPIKRAACMVCKQIATKKRRDI